MFSAPSPVPSAVLRILYSLPCHVLTQRENEPHHSCFMAGKRGTREMWT